ncbi:hypothetical protein HPB52_006421 [Rhipicephalus sanguineus]|uniref:Transposase Tc1-like domain-containing protein n=1 Tax=Rhipicephalus sanguineus TaxID=34632 RepID=A0A9D4Q4Y8_RHISA|nr:hypothetical protein HPB52_006421 [Rhipicephalus sanguineus]
MARVPDNERWEIVELYFKGRSQRKIAEAMGRTLKTVNRIVRAFKSCRRIKDAPRKPRSRVTIEPEDAWIVSAAAEKPGLSAQQIKNTLDLRASVTTVKRRLREAGLKSRIAAQKPLLRAQNKEKRLQFSRQHAQRSTEEWKEVVFTDECTFTTSCDQQARIWRPHNTGNARGRARGFSPRRRTKRCAARDDELRATFLRRALEQCVPAGSRAGSQSKVQFRWPVQGSRTRPAERLCLGVVAEGRIVGEAYVVRSSRVVA